MHRWRQPCGTTPSLIWMPLVGKRLCLHPSQEEFFWGQPAGVPRLTAESRGYAAKGRAGALKRVDRHTECDSVTQWLQAMTHALPSWWQPSWTMCGCWSSYCSPGGAVARAPACVRATSTSGQPST